MVAKWPIFVSCYFQQVWPPWRARHSSSGARDQLRALYMLSEPGSATCLLPILQTLKDTWREDCTEEPEFKQTYRRRCLDLRLLSHLDYPVYKYNLIWDLSKNVSTLSIWFLFWRYWPCWSIHLCATKQRTWKRLLSTSSSLVWITWYML